MTLPDLIRWGWANDRAAVLIPFILIPAVFGIGLLMTVFEGVK